MAKRKLMTIASETEISKQKMFLQWKHKRNETSRGGECETGFINGTCVVFLSQRRSLRHACGFYAHTQSRL